MSNKKIDCVYAFIVDDDGTGSEGVPLIQIEGIGQMPMMVSGLSTLEGSLVKVLKAAARDIRNSGRNIKLKKFTQIEEIPF